MLNRVKLVFCFAAVPAMIGLAGCGSAMKSAKMSETFTMGGGQWMVRRAVCATMLSTDHGDLAVETLDNYLVRVRGYIWNPSPAPLPINQELILVDKNGIQYDPHPKSVLATHPHDIRTLRAVPPGKRAEFACVFEVPSSVEDMELMILSPNGLHPPHRVELSIVLIRQ